MFDNCAKANLLLQNNRILEYKGLKKKSTVGTLISFKFIERVWRKADFRFGVLFAEVSQKLRVVFLPDCPTSRGKSVVMSIQKL